MIPVITSRSVGPMLRRLPTRRPNLAAVAVVTTACATAAGPADGSRPATTWL